MAVLTRFIPVLSLLSLFLVPAPARGSAAEVFGFGSKQAGVGGAVAARVDDFSSGYYNPAGLAFSGHLRLSLGMLGAASRLRINDEPYPIHEPVGVILGLQAPAPLGGPLKDRLHLAIGVYTLPSTIVRIIARQPEEPFYPYYDNRTQRLVILPAFAARVNDRLSLGLGLNILAKLAGDVVATEGQTRALDPRVDEEISTTVRINAGARFALRPHHHLALVFRQSFSVPFVTGADNRVAGEPIDLVVRAKGLFTPDQLVLGQWLRLGGFDSSLDLTWARWSAYPGPFVQVESELPLVGPLAGVLPKVPWKDTFGARLGLERALPLHSGGTWTARGGYGFETSPVPSVQAGVTNLLDGPKHAFSLGLGIGSRRLEGGRRLRLDLHAQVQLVGKRSLGKRVAGLNGTSKEATSFEALRDEVKDDPSEPETLGIQVSNPGYPWIQSGGEVYSGGVMFEVEL